MVAASRLFWNAERDALLLRSVDDYGIARGVEVAADLLAAQGNGRPAAACKVRYYRLRPVGEAHAAAPLVYIACAPLPHKRYVDERHVPPSCAQLRAKRDAEGRPYAPAKGSVWYGVAGNASNPLMENFA